MNHPVDGDPEPVLFAAVAAYLRDEPFVSQVGHHFGGAVFSDFVAEALVCDGLHESGGEWHGGAFACEDGEGVFRDFVVSVFVRCWPSGQIDSSP